MQIARLALTLQTLAALSAVVVNIASADTVPAHAKPRVDAGVHRTLQRQGTANIMVTMRDETKSVLENLPKEAAFPSRGDMITDMVTKLQANSKTSQADITKLLASEAAETLTSEVKSFWITNQVFFRDATFALVEKLATLSGVASIEEEIVIPLPSLTSGNATTKATMVADPQWGIAMVQAPDVWASGFSGQGIVVSTIDSGVRATHEILRNNFRKDYGWFDPENYADEPYDSNGHGSHTMGTLAGDNGYGVAPNATWITCKACRSTGQGGCPWSDLLSCAEFITCPTNPSGTVRDCSKAPHLVSNSWGTTYHTTQYADAIQVWRRAGIIPIFCNGNNGASCGTTWSPADDPNVIGVGATDSTDRLAYFSSRGPSVTGLTKPDISAPGESILSVNYYSDDSYIYESGTSMATPHVAGVIALLLSSEPTLNYEQVRQKLLFGTTDQTSLALTEQDCGDLKDGTFPNNLYGHGRVNAVKVVGSKRAPVTAQCSGLNPNDCDAAFFCMWSNLKQVCKTWW